MKKETVGGGGGCGVKGKVGEKGSIVKIQKGDERKIGRDLNVQKED